MTLLNRLRWSFLAGLSLLAILLAACGGSDGESAPRLSDPNQTGAALSDRFIALLKEKDIIGLQAFLSDGFLIQRADGSFATKEEYLTRLPAIGTYSIGGVVARQDGHTLAVKWQLAVNEVINGQVYEATPAPRLSTFAWSGKEWRMMAHANFNAPVVQDPLPPADAVR